MSKSLFLDVMNCAATFLQTLSDIGVAYVIKGRSNKVNNRIFFML